MARDASRAIRSFAPDPRITVFKSMKSAWRRVSTLPPGSRFQLAHEQHQRKHKHPATRIAVMGGAVLLILAGIVALVVPGPGLLMIAMGALLVARESASLSRGLDRFELWVRRRLWPGDAHSPR